MSVTPESDPRAARTAPGAPPQAASSAAEDDALADAVWEAVAEAGADVSLLLVEPPQAASRASDAKRKGALSRGDILIDMSSRFGAIVQPDLVAVGHVSGRTRAGGRPIPE